MIWLFGAGGRWATLLADGDTGWHIRAGEFLLDQRRWPTEDLFSFSKPGEPWYAWEWLSELLFALVFRPLGLKGVVLLAGAVIAAAAVVIFRQALWRGANCFTALAVSMLAVGAGSIHYLARPHVFTLLLWAVSLWLLERDGRRPGRAVWVLVPLAALWGNLHGGFVALLASLAVLAAGSACEALLEHWGLWPPSLAEPVDGRDSPRCRARRYLALLAACSLATLVNPYGFRLHLHIIDYLRSDWIRNAVDEFQSPKFRSENALHFEILLFAALALIGALLRRRRIAPAILLLFWAHAALISARHVPLFAVLAAPFIAEEAGRIWKEWAAARPARSSIRILDRVARDLDPGFRFTSIWVPALLLCVAVFKLPLDFPRDFPHQKFPVALVERRQERLAGRRVFTSDQWADYLLYRFYPRHRVFIDGRSDFYGPTLGKEYLKVMRGQPGWKSVLEKYRFEAVLAAPDWTVAGLLERHPGWRVVDQDATAILWERSAVAPASGCH